NVMRTAQKGFTLIELMIVIAIIGILAAVAIPAYQDYMRKAKISEGMQLMGGLKTGLETNYAEEGTLPNTGSPGFDDLGLTTTGKYAHVAYTKADIGTLVITFDNITGQLEIDRAQGKWTCNNGTPPLDVKILPKVCQ
ncbi:MAG: pilin, partial [Pseudomonadota bacterium]